MKKIVLDKRNNHPGSILLGDGLFDRTHFSKFKLSPFILMFLLLALSSQSFAQDRKTVGLVLSGGGSKGLVHIGVIRALEEAQIPIDYIGGTSMGAIIAGMYASGYSPDEMEKIFLDDDFQEWLSGDVGSAYGMFYKQDYPSPNWLSIRLGLQGKPKVEIPNSWISSRQMDYVFLEIFGGAMARSGGNFDSLMVPFFCIASDISCRKGKTLNSGDLSKAIRASMSIPFYFPPIRINDTLMFDGGLYNNFPVDILSDLHSPDIIIGCKAVGNFPPPAEESILSFLQNMVTVQTHYNIPKDKGVMIEPPTRDISLMDFRYMKEFIDEGYAETYRKMDSIRILIDGTATLAEISEKRNAFKKRLPPVNISRIEIEGVNPDQTFYLEKTLKNQIGHTALSIKEFKPYFFRLYPDLNIKSIMPSLQFNKELQSFVMHMDVDLQRHMIAKVGGCLSSSPISQLFFGVDLHLMSKIKSLYQTSVFVGRHYSSAHAAIRADFPSSTPFYIRWNITTHVWNYYRLRTPFFAYSARNYLRQSEQNTGFQIGLPFSPKTVGEAKFAYAQNYEEYYNRDFAQILDTPDKTRFRHFVTGFSLEANNIDYPQFITKGRCLRGVAEFVHGYQTLIPGTTNEISEPDPIKRQWLQFQVKYTEYFAMNHSWRLGVSFNGFYSFQADFLSYTSTLLNVGCYQPTFQSQTEYIPEYRSSQFLAAGIHHVILLNSIFPNLSVRFEGFIFAPIKEIVEKNKVFAQHKDEIFSRQYLIGSVTGVLQTSAGPLSLCLGYQQRRDSSKNPFTFMVNFGYLLPNKKAVER